MTMDLDSKMAELRSAVDDLRKKWKDSGYNTDDLKRLKATEKELIEAMAKKSEAETGERFRNLEQAAAWIAGAGYLVSARTVRNHADRAGFPKRQKDGAYLKGEVAAYAMANWENPSRPVEPNGGSTGSKEDLVIEQVRKLRINNDVQEGLYVLKSEAEQRAAAAAAYLKNDLANFGPKAVDCFVELTVDFLRSAGIDTDTINLPTILPDLLEQYDRSLEGWMDRYAKAGSFEDMI